MNFPITEVTRESGNLKCRIIADPRDCCAHHVIMMILRIIVSFGDKRHRISDCDHFPMRPEGLCDEAMRWTFRHRMGKVR